MEILKIYRTKKELTGIQVAEKIGITPTYYYKLENGIKKSLKPEKLFILKKELGISEKDFKKLVLFLNAPADERLQKIFHEIAEEI